MAVCYIGTYDIDNVEEFKRYGPIVAASRASRCRTTSRRKVCTASL